ncbi:transforming growth factor-beta-induced protein ig-h3-like isoform X2 [Patiria miniata]|uniref:FAS1 domain-containing protein n=1 Tax=Patiria miniata TaxID=46514 RepID=A0A914A419_PATMI|nr:transforming growth factor-beta-induced protein ig-h3-like isoform X2 [Patiria miniata]
MATTRKLPVLALLAILPIVFPQGAEGVNVLEVAKDNGASMFASMAGQCPWLANLLENSKEPNGFTVFAFNDKAYSESPPAFRKLIANTQTLQWALEYHVALGPTKSQDIKDNLLVTSLYPSPTSGASLPLQFIRTNIYHVYENDAIHRQVVTASGAQIVAADKIASNGIVHIIDKVMFPLPTGADVVEFIRDDGRFSTLYGFLEKANLTQALMTDPSRPLTVFAPNNQAFTNIPKPIMDKLMTNATYLQDVLEYHVAMGAYYAAGLYDNQTLMSLYRKPLLVQRGVGGIYVQDAKVLQADNTVSNGVVHEISAVMIPYK